MSQIELEITPCRHNYMKMQFHFPWTLEEIISELEQEDWRPYGMDTAVKHDIWTGKRFKVNRPKSSLLQKIVNFTLQDTTREYIVDKLYEHDPGFEVNWQMRPWRMKMNTIFHGEFTKDLPGFENGVHCDMRRLVATGMTYFADKDDERIASCFYDHPERHNPHRVETGFGKGWIHANAWNTWHDGWNRSDQVRYSMLTGLTLRLEHQPSGDDNQDKPVLSESN